VNRARVALRALLYKDDGSRFRKTRDCKKENERSQKRPINSLQAKPISAMAIKMYGHNLAICFQLNVTFTDGPPI